MTTHSGSCHCGQVAFEVDGEIGGGLACNCSMCQRKGSLLWFVPRAALRVTAGEDALAVDHADGAVVVEVVERHLSKDRSGAARHRFRVADDLELFAGRR